MFFDAVEAQDSISKTSLSTSIDAIQVEVRMKIHMIEANLSDETRSNERVVFIEFGLLEFSQRFRSTQNEVRGWDTQGVQ